MKNWWKHIDVKQMGIITKTAFCNFLLEKKILGRESESDKLIKKTIGVADLTNGGEKVLSET